MKGAGEAMKPADVVLRGPLGDVVIRDDGDGVFNAGDGIDIVLEGTPVDAPAQQLDQTGEEIEERLRAMGIRGIPPFGTQLKPLEAYVEHLRQARQTAGEDAATTPSEVEREIDAAKAAADEAGIAFDDSLEREIRNACGTWPEAKVYGELVNPAGLSGLSFIDVEHTLDTAEAFAPEAGIPAAQVARDAQNVRYVLSQQHFLSAQASADKGKMDEARAFIAEAANLADMGDFEDEFDEMLAEEYGRLVSDMSGLAGKSFIELERTLDFAAILAGKAGLPPAKAESDAREIRQALCKRHGADAAALAHEGKEKAARAALHQALSIADMGDFEDDAAKMKADVEKVLDEAMAAKKSPQPVAEKKVARYDGYAVRKQVSR